MLSAPKPDCCVYLHRRATDGRVFYVGKGKGHRPYSHQGRNRHWDRVKNKHGVVVEVLFDNLSESDALEEEVNVISEMRYFGEPLTNITAGGEGVSGYKHNEEALRKMSDRAREMWSDDSFRDMVSERHKERFATTDVRERVSETMSRIWGCEHKRKDRSRRAREWWSSENNREKMSRMHRDRLSDPAERERMSNTSSSLWADQSYIENVINAKTSIKKTVICSNGMTFESAAWARRWLLDNGFEKALSGNIHKCCKGASKTAYGYGWQYGQEPESATGNHREAKV